MARNIIMFRAKLQNFFRSNTPGNESNKRLQRYLSRNKKDKQRYPLDSLFLSPCTYRRGPT